MTPVPARSFVSRARNVIIFVAIVWGVAATFVAFEVAALGAMDFVLSYPAVFGELALSRTVTQSTSCTVPGGETPAQPPTAMSASDVRVGSWSLGVSLGRDAVLRQYVESDRQILGQLASGRSDLATQLGIPPPDVFTPEQIANANTEFVAFIEQGPASDTARGLAVVLSPQACELFKLGALWGYSEMVRPALPGERAVFAMEIRHHATRAGVPEPLWSPMLVRTPADAKRDDIITSMEMLNAGMTNYLAGRQ